MAMVRRATARRDTMMMTMATGDDDDDNNDGDGAAGDEVDGVLSKCSRRLLGH
jgi:hypothetical protein